MFKSVNCCETAYVRNRLRSCCLSSGVHCTTPHMGSTFARYIIGYYNTIYTHSPQVIHTELRVLSNQHIKSSNQELRYLYLSILTPRVDTYRATRGYLYQIKFETKT
jgi:hypothetical protein